MKLGSKIGIIPQEILDQIDHSKTECSDRYITTRNSDGFSITHEDFNGYWMWFIWGEGETTYKVSGGDWTHRTFNEDNKILTFRSSSGSCWKFTYDEGGEELTHEDVKPEDHYISPAIMAYLNSPAGENPYKKKQDE